MATEKRLIDANECCERAWDYTAFYHHVADMSILRDLLNDCPTVDAVEVVRCKDCKHWHEETGWCYYHSHFIGAKGEACHPWESNDWKMLNADDFCSYGERKDNGLCKED